MIVNYKDHKRITDRLHDRLQTERRKVRKLEKGIDYEVKRRWNVEKEKDWYKQQYQKALGHIIKLEKALNKACGLLEEQLCCPLEAFDEEMKNCDSFYCDKVKPEECWKEWCLHETEM